MKRMILAAVLGIATPLRAQAPLTAAVDLVSHYVFRGVNVLDGGPVLQPWASLALGRTGLTFTAWTSYALSGRSSEVNGVRRADLDELDLTLTYTHTMRNVALTAGAIYYSYPNAETFPGNATDTQELYLGLGLPGFPLAPTLTAYYDTEVQDGWYVALGGTRSVPVGLPLDLGASIGYTNQNFRPRAGVSDVNLALGMSIPLTGRVLLTPTVAYTYVPKSGAVEADSILWGKVQLRWSP